MLPKIGIACGFSVWHCLPNPLDAPTVGNRGMENRIKEHRERSGLTMEQLAERIGKSISAVNRLEKGQSQLTYEDAEILQRIFGLARIEDVVRQSDKPAPSGFADDVQRLDGLTAVRFEPGTNRDVWIVTSNALERLGLIPGNQIAVDISAEAVAGVRMGDAVICQLYEDMTATTLLRQFVEPDLLITNMLKNNAKILNRREHDVAIKGIVSETLTILRRPRT